MPPKTVPVDVDLDALAERLAPLVAARLAQAMVTRTSAPYSTRRGCGPAGLKDRTWKKIAPMIPGAQHSGRWVIVQREAYEKWASRDARPSTASAATGEPWSPAAALASVGLRAPRGGA